MFAFKRNRCDTNRWSVFFVGHKGILYFSKVHQAALFQQNMLYQLHNTYDREAWDRFLPDQVKQFVSYKSPKKASDSVHRISLCEILGRGNSNKD